MTLPLEFQLIVRIPPAAPLASLAPFAALGVLFEGDKIASIDYLPHDYCARGMTESRPQNDLVTTNELVTTVKTRLRNYLQNPGNPKSACFGDLPLCGSMRTPRERFCDVPLPLIKKEERIKVRPMVRDIRHGGLRAYVCIAAECGWHGPFDPLNKVGAACNNSPFAIVIPCYRVVRKGGRKKDGRVWFRLGEFWGNAYMKCEECWEIERGKRMEKRGKCKECQKIGWNIKRSLLEHEGVKVVKDKTREMSEWKCFPRTSSVGG